MPIQTLTFLKRMTACAALLLTGLLAAPPARALETNVRTRDPSTIVKRGGTYWVYGTGLGVQQFSSTDRVHWTRRGPMFPTPPTWVAATVPGNKDNVSWAPDIHLSHGLYFLYYSYSSWGSSTSGIGVATNPTLDPHGWKDQGLVVASGAGKHFNAIDPCIFQDSTGAPWLSYGSYNDGIHLIRIDPQTGRQAPGDPAVYNLATRPSVPGNAIEASCVYYHDSRYYLFVNWDACCAGSQSSYNIRVGRSKTVTGPYLDKAGKDMHDGGGTLFLGSVRDDGTGRPFDDQVGPGHAGFLVDTDGPWFSYHEEWTRDQNGETTMNLNRLAWDSDGWPRLVLDPGPFQIVSSLSTHDVVKAEGGAPARTWPWENSSTERWTLAYQGDGDYSILSADGKALSVMADRPTPGSKVELDTYHRGRDTQKWFLRQDDDGTYCLLTKSGGKSLALDVSGNSLLDGTPLQVWTANGLNCQKWSFRIH